MESSGHPEVDDQFQRRPIRGGDRFQAQQQVLAPTVHAREPVADGVRARGELGRGVGPPGNHDGPPDQRIELPAYRLDLGELGHRRSVPAADGPLRRTGHGVRGDPVDRVPWVRLPPWSRWP